MHARLNYPLIMKGINFIRMPSLSIYNSHSYISFKRVNFTIFLYFQGLLKFTKMSHPLFRKKSVPAILKEAEEGLTDAHGPS